MVNKRLQITALQEVKYRKPLAKVREYIKGFNVIPESDIRIYVDYPIGWHAEFGAGDRVYIITSNRGNLSLSIEPIYGYRPNGSIIRKG